MTRVLATAVGLALLCSAVAASAAGPRLDLMPLPRSALGPGSGPLKLAPDSGVVSNSFAARDAGRGVTGADLARLGRITGFSLDYVLPNAIVPQKRHELLGVRTIAELYSDRATATAGLGFWLRVTRQLSQGDVNGVTVAVSAFRAHVADGSFALELVYRHAGQPLYYVGDIVFRSGRLLGAVFVSATDADGLRARTVELAHSLARRIARVRAGA